MHFWSKKSKKIFFWKSLINQFGINNSLNIPFRQMVRQFWCKSLCFTCKKHSFKFSHASFPNHKRCGLCPLCFQTGMLLLWHIAYIGKAQRFCSVVFLLPNEIFVLKVPPLLYYLAPTDQRTDVWSGDFIIWKISSGLWAVVWDGLWNKRVLADYEQLLKPVF